MSMPAQPQYPGSPQGGPGSPSGFPGLQTPGVDGKVPGKGMKKAGLIMLIVGLVLCLIGIVVFVVAIVKVVGVASDVSDNSTVFNGSATIELEAGKDMQAYVHEGETGPSCTIVGADGTNPDTGTVNQKSTVTTEGTDWESFGSFTAKSTQEYTITCDSPNEVMVAPPVSVGGIVGSVGGIIGGLLVGGFGFLLLVVGVILFFVGRSKAKKAQNPAF
ncbi:hypothetical protein Bra3105_06215 [Brachybacterium halotolerans subsp. kimchii]|uniref:hypothetical protein n=1 Tax=Brachybacterium halotolerans TaxID=2795215 RepID=UPI001E411903|nr:hypothetical protein [Brachybacterium halotolerans]UEJ83901.1 hypothetical protein Bra3105_06215 [Brachybacterium halotolerans subsp. kimchii]